MTATAYMYRKFREIWTCRFLNVRADRQTYRHAHRNALHPTEDEVATSTTESLLRYCGICQAYVIYFHYVYCTYLLIFLYFYLGLYAIFVTVIKVFLYATCDSLR